MVVLLLSCLLSLLSIFTGGVTSSYLGCFFDGCPRIGTCSAPHHRVLGHASYSAHDMTIIKCINLCLDITSNSVQYAGVEAGSECYCGLQGSDYAQLGTRGDEECSEPCAGDKTQMCGADFAIAVYDLYQLQCDLPTFDNGYLLAGSVPPVTMISIRTTINFYCDPGYSINGNTNNRCVVGYSNDAHGQWDGSPPLCQAECIPACSSKWICREPNTCTCPDGYTGSTCTTPICSRTCFGDQICIAPETCSTMPYQAPCDNSPCQNGGTCYINTGFATGYHCTCALRYQGDLCETAVCTISCSNGGLCTAPNVCSCPNGYSGSRCETAVCPQSCTNGGTCTPPNVCSCPNGYSGSRCEIAPCHQSLCQNGGTCYTTTASASGYYCSCFSGYSGDYCENETIIEPTAKPEKPTMGLVFSRTPVDNTTKLNPDNNTTNLKQEIGDTGLRGIGLGGVIGAAVGGAALFAIIIIVMIVCLLKRKSVAKNDTQLNLQTNANSMRSSSDIPMSSNSYQETSLYAAPSQGSDDAIISNEQNVQLDSANTGITSNAFPVYARPDKNKINSESQLVSLSEPEDAYAYSTVSINAPDADQNNKRSGGSPGDNNDSGWKENDIYSDGGLGNEGWEDNTIYVTGDQGF